MSSGPRKVRTTITTDTSLSEYLKETQFPDFHVPVPPPWHEPVDQGHGLRSIIVGTLTSIMPPSLATKKMKSKKKRRLEGTAALYTEDIGTEGLKNLPGTVAGSSASSTGGRDFQLLVDDEEERKRRKRMVRLFPMG